MWEDIQWAAPLTLDLLQVLIDRALGAPILVVLTFRSDFAPAWAARPHMKQLSLARLGRGSAARLIAKLAGARHRPPDIVQQILEKTDGIPLFIEELTRMALETGTASPLPGLAIPTTLRDLLMARLERLGPAKEVAQLGAALGRAFAHEVIQAVWSLNDQALQRSLERLASTDIVSQKGEPPHTRWVFKHPLIQDAACQSLFKSKRLQLHEHIAHVLEECFPETVETRPELLAHHYTRAGLREEARGYWKRAGQRAFERSAYVEALEHLGHGLALLVAGPIDERSPDGLAAVNLGVTYRRFDEAMSESELLPSLVLRAGGIIAGDYDTGAINALGDGDDGFEVSGTAGKYFADRFALSAEFGYRKRNNNIPDNLFLQLSGGALLWNRVSLSLSYERMDTPWGSLDIGPGEATGVFFPARFRRSQERTATPQRQSQRRPHRPDQPWPVLRHRH